MHGLVLLCAALLVACTTLWWAFGPQTASHARETASSRQVALLAPAGGFGHDLSVVDAYAAIPHRRTAFSERESTRSHGDARYLSALFAWTDLAVVERVTSQRALWSQQHSSLPASSYDAILEGLSSLETPRHLRPAQDLIESAISDQRAYFDEWQASGRRDYFKASHALVQSSHRKLIAAYKKLKAAYGDEPAHNKRAFFDHLCALDFI
ncbi:MAG: hypothetical protein AAF495_19615 [Pseudomonadota bacterium]